MLVITMTYLHYARPKPKLRFEVGEREKEKEKRRKKEKKTLKAFPYHGLSLTNKIKLSETPCISTTIISKQY
jgi:hypothetical protein